MKISVTISLLLLTACNLLAGTGDTIKVRSHDRVHMNWYGNFDRKVHLPTQGKTFNRVWMHYTLGCPDKGCSEWDYTTQVFLMKNSGLFDSTLMKHSNFQVGGIEPDSFHYTTEEAHTYSWNAQTMQADSFPLAPSMLVRFQNPQTPQTPTDTMYVWPAPWYRYVFDQNGNKTDSVEVPANGSIYKQEYSWYQVFEVQYPLELGRVITPYAGDKTKTWSYTYSFDVTDFISELQDTQLIRAHYSGYQDGFTITLDFEFIEGPSAMECYQVIPLWQGGFPYGDPNTSIETYLNNRSFQVDNAMQEAKLRVIQTGHGFGGNENCAEFCPKYHYVKINGTQKFSSLVWKDDCGANPIYPQTGTWLYDRANWCPGSEVKPFDYFIGSLLQKSAGNSVDLDMEPFINNGNNFCSYIVSGYIFLYKKGSINLDASVDEIISPSNKLNFVRNNPNCGIPRIRFSNNGSDTITRLLLRHGIEGGNMQDFEWKGKISPFTTLDMDLGYFDWTGAGNGKYKVSVAQVNGVSDGFAGNDVKTSTFGLTPVWPSEFQVWFRANRIATDNKLFVKDIAGNIIWQRSGFTANTMHYDTVRLNPGCYYFEVTDESKNGFKFWANQDGTGSLNVRQISGAVLRNIDGDFGSFSRQYFTVGYQLSLPETSIEASLFPNPTGSSSVLEFSSTGKGQVLILDASGRQVGNIMEFQAGWKQMELPRNGLTPGVYLIRIETGEGTKTLRWILN